MTAYVTLDVETTIKFSFKRKGNPFDPENWIVMPGWVDAEEEWGHALYFNNREESHASSWFRDVLDRTKLIVGYNIKYDIHHLIQCPENYEAWMDWIADGGTIWDCQLAEYLLNGMGAQDQYLSLDEVAPRYGGNLKVDEVKLLWEDGVDTPDIDRDLLERYLVGEPETGDEGDLGNTRLIFRGQLARARKSGQLKSILLNMGSLVYTIEAEHQGMAVDYELGCKLAAEREQELAALTEELAKFIPDDLPFEFNWGSRNHLSALIFGGQVKYVAKAPILDDEGNLTYYQKDATAYSFGGEWRTPVENGSFDEDMLAKADRYGSGKRKGELKTKKVKVPDLERGPKERNEDFYYTFPGFTKPRKEWETKTPGVYSTAADTIEALGNRGIPFLKTLAEHSLVSKDLKTYFITTDEKTGEKKGMLTLVDNGIIHHSLNHVNTVTGRFSSSNPNLQNLSGKGKSKVKSLFVSRYPNGKVIQSDFTSLEIYIQAILTGCRQLIDDLKAGLDMHCLRVSQKEGIPYEEAVLKCKGSDTVAPLPEWEKKRSGAKEFSFQRAYGAGIAKIAETTGMTEEDVQALADAEAERYPEIEAYFERITLAIEQSTKLTGVKVPHPDFPAKIVELGRGYHRTPDGKLYSWRQNPAPKYIVERSGKWASYSPPEVRNYEVQGGGAEWAKAAMWLAVRAYYSLQNFDGQAVLVNQVHDACYADAAEEVAPKAAALLHVAMEHASPFIESYFNWPQPVYVPSDTTWGSSMIEEKKPEGMHEHIEWATSIITSFYK